MVNITAMTGFESASPSYRRWVGRHWAETLGSVSAGVILTHFVGVKLTHLGEDGGFCAAHADSGANSVLAPTNRCVAHTESAVDSLVYHIVACAELALATSAVAKT